jgi:peptidoglycan/xylan/chitin deacetylase (PgdA/CDA1 family)
MLPRRLLVRQLVPAPTPCVLLTFDDGPHPHVTEAVLDRLDAYRARAVFFLIGQRVEQAPRLLRRIQERGHLLGNHTYLHADSYILSDRPRPGFREYARDIRRCQAVIQEHTGSRPKLFRPPGGRLTPSTLLAPWYLGLKSVTWSLEVADWRFRSTAEARRGAEELARDVAPGDIVLLHDDNSCVLDVLDAILPVMESRRYDLFSAIDYL